jgi:hypothetical protein
MLTLDKIKVILRDYEGGAAAKVSQRYEATWNEEHGALWIDIETCLPRTPLKGLQLEKSVDQRKIFGTNRAPHGATPEFTLPKTWEPPSRGKPGALSHFCVQQPVNMT